MTIKLGVSSCLLGVNVRYDGGHRLDLYITDTLGRYFTIVQVCPEVECGMPVPREAMRLEGDPASPRMVTIRSRIDKSEQMLAFCRTRVRELEGEDLCGFIFKKGSPSCGVSRVKVFGKGPAAVSGSGLFAAAMTGDFPLLPVVEEGQLNDPDIRGNFIERVFAFRRWKDLIQDRPDLGRLVAFHARHKLQIMAHSPSIYRGTGALVARGKEMEWQDLLHRYGLLFMKGLALHATIKKNSNVLMHIMGYFKKELSRAEKEELLGVINRYREQVVPLIVPVTLLNHYVYKYEKHYLQQQTYVSPHPAELMLRNHY